MCAQPHYETTVLLTDLIARFLLSYATRVVNDFKVFIRQDLLQLAILSDFQLSDVLGCSETIHYRHGNIHEHQFVGVYVFDILVGFREWTSFGCHPLINEPKSLLSVVCLV